MKKKALALTLCALLTLSLAACGGQSAAEEEPAKEDTEEVTPASEAESFPTDDALVSDDTLTEDNIGEFVKLGTYKGLQIDAPEDTAIENGMTANIDFAGSIDGEYFEGGTSEAYDLEIGSGSFIDNFEEQLIGHKAGDEVDVHVTFPENYGQTDLAGKEALFEVTVNSVCYQTADSAFASLVDSSEILKYPADMVASWEQMYIDQYGPYVTSTTDEDVADDTEDADAESDEADDAEEADTDSDDADDAGTDDADAAGTDSDADADDAAAQEVTLAEIGALFGMSEDTLRQMILSNLKYILVSRAVLAEEGITRDSDAYGKALQSLIEDYGFSSLEEALSAGIPEEQFYDTADSRAAIQVLIDNQAS